MEKISAFHAPASNLEPSFGKWDFRFLLLVLLLFAWRTLFLAISPLDLSADEAYYWDWSRSLDWGYYSKPPMVAWVDALSTRLVGVSAFAVRLPAVLFGTLGLVFLYLTARRLFDARTAFWSAAAGSASIGVCAANFIMTIDAPLLFFWSAALYTFWRAIEPQRGTGWWILSGILLGLGALSKQMMLIFPPLMAIFFLLRRDERLLRQKSGPWVATLIMILFLAPVVYWNVQHDWITFKHTTHHFEGSHGHGLYFLRTVGDFIGAQAALITPLTWLLFAAVTGHSLVNVRRLSTPVRFVVVFGGFLFFFFLLFSFRQRIYGNWPAVCYLSGIIMVAAWYTGRFSCGRRIDRLRSLFIPGIVLGAFLAAMTYVLPLAMPGSLLGGNDPTSRLKGWKEMAQGMDGVVSAMPPQDPVFILASKRDIASELAFYMKNHPRVYLWNEKSGEIASQYDLWPGPAGKLGNDAFIVLEEGKKPDKELLSSFRSIRRLGSIGAQKVRGAGLAVDVYLGEHLLQWPR